MRRRIILPASALFDRLQNFWEGQRVHVWLTNLLVLVFMAVLILVEFNRRQWLPVAIAETLPRSHFYSVSFAFTLLLIVEVIGLVFSLADSVANSVGKQFEVLSLILLRQSFKQLVYFPEPLHWIGVNEAILHILADAFTALILFLLLALYYRMQRHAPICRDEVQQGHFIAYKKTLALLLLITFTLTGLYDLFAPLLQNARFDFFASFYTILIFSDILIVLVSLRYSYSYATLFRNSGFALTTVLIRMALSAPHYFNALLGLLSMLFAIGLTFSYNHFMRSVPEEEK